MNAYGMEDKERARKERAKKAIALAMHSRWDAAVEANHSILKDFPQDLEAYNRLGKAFSELGRTSEAKGAFQRALEISPSNGIAKKNLDRLMRLGDETPGAGSHSNATPPVFIEESGKSGTTHLVNLASPTTLLKLSPGHPVQLQIDRNGLGVFGPSGEYLGQVEPKLASRLTRLMNGGNRYQARVTSVDEQGLTVIIQEVFKHPSQAGTASFALSGGAGYRVYMPSTMLGYELADEENEEAEPVAVKDWTDDDTEPGDDDAYSPAFHRIIDTANEGPKDNDGDDF